MTDHQREVARGRGLDELVAVGDVRRERLLDEHVLAGLQRLRARARGGGASGRAITIASTPGSSSTCASDVVSRDAGMQPRARARAAPPRVADRDELRGLGRDEVAGEVRAPVAVSDQCHFERWNHLHLFSAFRCAATSNVRPAQYAGRRRDARRRSCSPPVCQPCAHANRCRPPRQGVPGDPRCGLVPRQPGPRPVGGRPGRTGADMDRLALGLGGRAWRRVRRERSFPRPGPGARRPDVLRLLPPHHRRRHHRRAATACSTSTTARCRAIAACRRSTGRSRTRRPTTASRSTR